MKNVYVKETRAGLGVSSLPNGKEMYKSQVKFHAGNALTPEEIHQFGLQRVEEISEEILQIGKRMGMNSNRFIEMIIVLLCIKIQY